MFNTDVVIILLTINYFLPILKTQLYNHFSSSPLPNLAKAITSCFDTLLKYCDCLNCIPNKATADANLNHQKQ